MDYLNTVYSGLHKFLMLNTATLSGAVDIIVVQHPVLADTELDKSEETEMCERAEEHGKKKNCYFTSTPFHIRFGKLKLLNAAEHIVQIKINNRPVELKMKLGAEGVAYFEQPAEEDMLRDDMESVYLSNPPLDLIEKYRIHTMALSDDVLMRSSSVTASEISQIKPSGDHDTHSTQETKTSREATDESDASSQMEIRTSGSSLSASSTPAQAPQCLTQSADGNVIG